MNIRKINIFNFNNPKINYTFVLGLFFFIYAFTFSNVYLFANGSEIINNLNYHKVKLFNYDKISNKISNKLFEIDLECSEKDNNDLITILNDKELEYLNLENIDYKVIIENYNIKLNQELKDASNFNVYLEKLKIKQTNLNKQNKILNQEQNYFNINELIDDYIPLNFRFGNFYNYHLLQEIYDNFDQMQKLYPEFINKTIIGYTHNKLPIYVWNFNFGNNQLNNKKVLLTALHHAREPITASGLIYSFWWLLENYKNDNTQISIEIAKLLENNNIYVVPCVNPDGYLINNTNTNTGLWRKNAKVLDNKVVGVDINRNYGPNEFWNYPNPDGSSTYIHAETYRGEKEFSEPETKAIQKLCLENNFVSNINFHSFGNLNIIPNLSLQGSTKNLLYEKLFLNNFFRTKYLFGTDFHTVGYSTRGTADDWMNQVLDKQNPIFSYTPELDYMFYQLDSNKIILGMRNGLYSVLNNLKMSSKFPIINKYEFINNSPLTLKLYIDNLGFESFENIDVQLEKNITKDIIKPINDYKKILNQNETSEVLIEFDNYELNQSDTIVFIKIYDNNNLIEVIKLKQNFNEYMVTNILNPNDILFDKNYMKNNFNSYEKYKLIDLDSTNWGINFIGETAFLTESKDSSYNPSQESILEFKEDFILNSNYNFELVIEAEWLIERKHDSFMIRLFDSVNNTYTYLESNFSMKRRYYENGSLTTTEFPMLEGYFPDNNILRFNLSKLKKNYNYKLQFLFVSDKSKNFDGMKIFDVKLLEYLPNKLLSFNNKDNNVKNQNNQTKSLIINKYKVIQINDINNIFNTKYNNFDELEIKVYNLLGEEIFSSNSDNSKDFSQFLEKIVSLENQKQILFVSFSPLNELDNSNFNNNNTINSKTNYNMYLKLLIE